MARGAYFLNYNGYKRYEKEPMTDKQVSDWWDKIKDMPVNPHLTIGYSIDKEQKGVYTYGGRVYPRRRH